MQKLAGWIIAHKRSILITFSVLLVLSVFGFLQVGVNYDMVSYLPQDTESTKAIQIMQEEFDSALPNLRVMVPVVDIGEALAVKAALSEFDFVQDVLWLDDQIKVSTPLDLHDSDVVSSFYADECAMYTVTVSSDLQESEIVSRLREWLPEGGALGGQLVDMGSAQDAVKSEVTAVLLVALPLVLLILLLSSTSWLDPILFLVTIGVGVLLNFGTNLFLGDVSFITQSVAGVLQLAVTMDYTIYLLHRFEAYRGTSASDEEAMQKAIVKSLPAIAASALTTFFGFLALVFMRFGIGSNLGIVLAKGVVLSFITVTMLLPVLVLLLIKPLDRLSHKNVWPSFSRFGKAAVRIGPFVLILALIAAYPMFNWSRQNAFVYGMGAYPEASVEARDQEAIKSRFGQHEQMVLLIPRGTLDIQAQLVDDLNDLPGLTSVIDYTSMVGRGIPEDFVPEAERRLLLSDHYSRLILVADVPAESDETFVLAEQIRELTASYFPENSYLAGSSFSLVDMRDTIQRDDLIVNGLAILAVALVILFTFRSFLLPILLVFTIELSIWINLAIPYLQNLPISYIGYLIISTVQLGATVDYAILLTQNYQDERKILPTWEAAARAAGSTARTVIPPAFILAGAGFSLSIVSSITIVSELGLVLGRGALISLVMVLFFLPAALALSDRLIDPLSFGKKDKTSQKAKQVKEKGLTHETK